MGGAALEVDYPTHSREATVYVRIMRLFMAIALLLGAGMLIFCMLTVSPTKGR